MPNQVYKLSSHLLCLPSSLLDSVFSFFGFLMIKCLSLFFTRKRSCPTVKNKQTVLFAYNDCILIVTFDT